MTLTINYKNGEFTCTFTPDGDSSLPVIIARAVTADIDDAVAGDRESNSDQEATAEDVEMTFCDQEEFPTGAEGNQGAIVDGSPVSPAIEHPENGRVALYSETGNSRFTDHTK